jgi:hypothetical protein
MPAPAAESPEGTSRLRLKSRLNLPDEASTAASLIPPPPPPPPAPAALSPPLPVEPPPEAEPEPDEAPKFKLRPKSAAGSLTPPPPPPHMTGAAPSLPPPPPPPVARIPIAPEPLPEPPPPERTASAMPPMSILAAPPPPPPSSRSDVPPPLPPAPVPRLSLSSVAVPEKPKGAKGGALGRIAAKLPKIGGKPFAPKHGGTRAPMGKQGKVLRRRSALSPVAKAGMLVVILCVAVGGYFSFRIFFPEEAPPIRIKPLKPLPGDGTKSAIDGPPKVVTLPSPVPDLANADTDSSGGDKPIPTPSPTPVPSGPNQIVMGDTNISSDVRVGNTPLDAAPAASAAFRSFVANAVIGGVFQGTPARALINGTIVREGQVVNSSLGVAFERIDARRKMIFFKDYTGAEVSKSY